MTIEIRDFQSIPWKNIIKVGEKRMLNRPIFNIGWIVGRFCNYNCSYCWPYGRSDKYEYADFEVYTNFIDEVKRQARENGFTEFHWGFSGGEPTAYKKMLELIKHLDDGITPFQSIHMTTNLSPGKIWWKRWCETTLSMQERYVTGSFHAEFADEIEFGDKCLLLIENNVGVTINQVMVPKLFWETYERCKRFYERGINVTLKPQSNPTAQFIVHGYTKEMLDTMQTGFPRLPPRGEFYQLVLSDEKGNDYDFDQAERLNAFDFNKFRGWDCSSGFQSLIVKENEVRRGFSCHDVPIGTLTNFKLFKLPKACIAPSCVASVDAKIPKWKYDI